MPELITFAESQGKETFDWNEFLDRATKGKVSEQEYIAACRLAGQWVTCAVGNQCEIIPRDPFCGHPIDEDLLIFGADFYHILMNKEYFHARILLDKIEKRSAELIREILEMEKRSTELVREILRREEDNE